MTAERYGVRLVVEDGMQMSEGQDHTLVLYLFLLQWRGGLGAGRHGSHLSLVAESSALDFLLLF